MLKRVHIETVLRSVTHNGEDVIRSESQGTCQIEKSGVMLRYAEAENYGHATLVVADGLADLCRKGAVTSRMTFVEGRLLPCPYRTAGHELGLALFTHSFEFELHAGGGRLHLTYTLLSDGVQIADNELTIAWAMQ